MQCLECKEHRQNYSGGFCRRCKTKQLNGRALQVIAKGFRPASDYNGELFKIFMSDFDGRHIKNSDLPVAKRLAAYLAAHAVAEISSWLDVYDISDKANIRYTNHASHGCPFDRIGRALERSGRIGRRQDARIVQFKNMLEGFPLEARPLMTEFYQDISSSHKRTSSALKVLTSVKIFCQLIKKPLFKATEKDAETFLRSLNNYSAAHFTERYRSLNRFYSWAKTRGHCVKNPFDQSELSNLRRTCKGCNQTKTFWTSDLFCDECYRNQLFQKKHVALVADVGFKCRYNQHLFNLYLKYINRYKIRGRHIRTTKLLIKFFGEKELSVMKSWIDVWKIRRDFLHFNELKTIPTGGCPIEKIAYVLQELGVLPIREEDHKIYVETALLSTVPDFAKLIREYFYDLRRQKRSWRSLLVTFRMVHGFFLWQVERGVTDIFTTSEQDALDYILSTKNNDKSGVLRRVLDKFYRWSVYKKKTLFNPFATIPSIKLKPSLEICSNDVIRKLEKFIKKSTSDPEGALILCLIFYFGFIATDLAMANLEVREDFRITLHRQSELTYGHKMHARDQVLSLPTEPAWLLNLQRRYFSLWQVRYNKIKKDFPLSPLLLRSDSRHSRHLRSLAVRDRVKTATVAAVGFEIPTSVIRRTGAHVYAAQVDAAILTQFGWSKDYSFDFVWRQRQLFTPKQK